MKQVMVSGGSVRLEDVPAPVVEPGTVLVRMDHSCISIGTEMSGLTSSGLPLWKRALRQPQNVKKVVDMILSDGFAQTRRVVQERLGVALPTGYSGAGLTNARAAIENSREKLIAESTNFHGQLNCEY